MAAPFTDAEIETIRAATPGCRDELIHLNHAGSSLPAQTVLDAQIEHLQREATIGGYEAAAATAAEREQTYESIAALLGAKRNEIARFEHATAAWSAAFWSIPMQPGQAIITHDHDYGANAVAMLHAAATRGVRIVRVPSDAVGQIDLAALAAALDDPDGVALVSLAWIPTNGGLVNPAAAVGALTRAAGVPFLLDACQAVGQLVIDVDTIGCDFLSGTGRKYLRGPRGTGFLYVRESILDRVVPSHPDHHSAEWTTLDTYTFEPGATRFEYWEFSHANWLGLGAAVDVALDLGVDRIQTAIARRAKDLRAGLSGIGMEVHDEGIARCGIVTATHPTLASDVVQARLAEQRINTSVTHVGSSRADVERRDLAPMLRLSAHCTTTAAEVDHVCSTLAEL
ncbi:aminotransferase class V-fold PLP-dependent enzyme [Ilumatobacter coccineus]|uniref:Putative transferase n=1 Tax=Ilumatobacter coccineus (strain NBRC 103263 / KCTC 29153 / YM16-304) TaxID=1313172 RepID=A0A6C7E4Z2_ILUCY|nr:aminotransferase class V-fold PLP-dependent enzyme [Ilumatobacter coccineus]BAN00335.1 putative transferase [Ilumatobacter coccineus YM16-304]